jgi:hypothetical protein
VVGQRALTTLGLLLVHVVAVTIDLFVHLGSAWCGRHLGLAVLPVLDGYSEGTLACLRSAEQMI